MFVEVTVLGILIFLLVLYGKWKQHYWARKGVPQLKPSLVFGDFQSIMTGSTSLQDYFEKLYKVAQTKGTKHLGIYNLWMPEYMPIDLKIIKNIMTKDFSHFDSHGLYYHKTDVLSEHLFSMEGEAWKERRVKMTPTFTSGKMKMMYETLLDKAVGLKKVINEAAKTDKPVAIKDVMARFATDIIASIAFGLDCNTLEQPEHKFRDIGRKALKPRLFKFLLETIVNYDVLAMLGYSGNLKEVKTYFIEIVKDTIKYRDTHDVQRKDFMQLLLQLRNKGNIGSDDGLKSEGKHTMSENEIISEAFLFYLAGFETSSSTMTFAFIELSQHPDMQEKLRQEINDTLDKYDGKLTYDALLEMEYLDKVVRETLRKYPVLADLPRLCTKTYKVPDTDLVIQKGTVINIPVIGIHRDPQYYPNPDEFNPENFSLENKAKRPDFAYLPFGEGPRMCIGMRFGLMQTKMGIVTLVKDFKLALDKSTQPPFELEPSSVVFTTKQEVLLRVSKV